MRPIKLRQFYRHWRDFFINEESEVVLPSSSQPPEVLPTQVSPLTVEDKDLVCGTHAYIAGYIARKILRRVRGCAACKADLLYTGDNPLPEHFLIEARRYTEKTLCIPATQFRKDVSFLCSVISVNIANHSHLPFLKHNLLTILYDKWQHSYNCETHKLKSLLANNVIEFYTFTWVRNVNNVLHGRVRRQIFKDPVKTLAHERFLKLKTRRNAVNKIKMLQNK